MPGRLLHVLQLRAVLKRGRDEGRAHRVGRVTTRQADLRCVFPHQSVNRVGVHPAGRIVRLGIAADWTEQRRFELVAVAGALEIGADALGGLRVDGERITPAALAGDAQRIEAPVLVKIADIQGGDLGATESDLQADRENGAVAQAGERVVRRRVENFPGLRFRERRRAALVAVDGRPLNVDDGFRVAAPCLTRCLNRLDRAARRRRTVEAAAPSCSRCIRSQAMMAR